jgi:hypothetical protein
MQDARQQIKEENKMRGEEREKLSERGNKNDAQHCHK